MNTDVLVVDDNPLNQKLVFHVLHAAGMRVRQASDAVQAQAELAGYLPDIVLMDLALPGMDGLTLTRKLRLDSRYSRLPIVAFSAFAFEGDNRNYLQAGCNGCISKPINTRTLADLVRSFICVPGELSRPA